MTDPSVLGCLVAAVNGLDLSSHMEDVLEAGLGGIVLFSRNAETVAQVRQLTDAIHELNPRALVMVDEEGGAVSRLDRITGGSFPSAHALGFIDDVELTREVAAHRGRLLKQVGIDLCLGPVADLRRHPDNPVVGSRSFGGDPELVARHVEATILGTRSSGVACCVKHFPGHGITDIDSHESKAISNVDEMAIRRVHLTPFQSAVAAGVEAVMPAHVIVPEWEERPASTSSAALALLRSELGFEGLIVSDAMDMAGVTSPVEVAVTDALVAGADLVLLGNQEPDRRRLDSIASRWADQNTSTLGQRRLQEGAGRRARFLRPPPSPMHSVSDRRVEAAQRAISWLDDAVPPPTDIETVLVVPPSWARGLQVDFDVVTSVRRAFPDARVVMGDDPTPEPDLIVTSDSAFDSAQSELVARLRSVDPSLVVVETGIPAAELTPPAGLLRGASPLNFHALARVLKDVLR